MQSLNLPGESVVGGKELRDDDPEERTAAEAHCDLRSRKAPHESGWNFPLP